MVVGLEMVLVGIDLLVVVVVVANIEGVRSGVVLALLSSVSNDKGKYVIKM